MMANSRHHDERPLLTGPYSAKIIAGQVGCSKAELYKWRRELERRGLVSIVAKRCKVTYADKRGTPTYTGDLYKVLTSREPFEVLRRAIDEWDYEQMKIQEAECLLNGEEFYPWNELPYTWPPMPTEVLQ
jgi:hypothetical protein